MTNKKTPANIRQTVWNIYIGEDIGKVKCPLCQQNDIRPFQFHCGHVIARSHGGSLDVSNLRPICSICNHSMYNHNMIEFAQIYYPNSPIHSTFKNLPGRPLLPIENNDKLVHKKSEKTLIEPIKKKSNKTINNLFVASPTASNEKKYICPYCKCIFKHQSSLSRHKNYRCQDRSKFESDKITIMEKQIAEEKRAIMEKQIAELKIEKQIAEEKMIIMEKQIAEEKMTTMEKQISELKMTIMEKLIYEEKMKRQIAELKMAIMEKQIAEEKMTTMEKQIAELKMTIMEKQIAELKMTIMEKQIAEKKMALMEKQISELKMTIMEKQISSEKMTLME